MNNTELEEKIDLRDIKDIDGEPEIAIICSEINSFYRFALQNNVYVNYFCNHSSGKTELVMDEESINYCCSIDRSKINKNIKGLCKTRRGLLTGKEEMIQRFKDSEYAVYALVKLTKFNKQYVGLLKHLRFKDNDEIDVEKVKKVIRVINKTLIAYRDNERSVNFPVTIGIECEKLKRLISSYEDLIET